MKQNKRENEIKKKQVEAEAEKVNSKLWIMDMPRGKTNVNESKKRNA